MSEKYSVLYDVLVKHEYQADVARCHQVRPKTVSLLVNQVKRNPELLRELHTKSVEKEQVRETIR